jgi:hypothetical protein
LTPTAAPVYFKALQEPADPGTILLGIVENTITPVATRGVQGNPCWGIDQGIDQGIASKL